MDQERDAANIISFDLQQIAWNHLERKRAFYSGVPMVMKEKWSDEEFQTLEGFKQLPDVLPIRPREKFIDLDYAKLIEWKKPYVPEDSKEEAKDEAKADSTPQGPPPDQHLYQYAQADDEDKKDYLSKFELVSVKALSPPSDIALVVHTDDAIEEAANVLSADDCSNRRLPLMGHPVYTSWLVPSLTKERCVVRDNICPGVLVKRLALDSPLLHGVLETRSAI